MSNVRQVQETIFPKGTKAAGTYYYPDATAAYDSNSNGMEVSHVADWATFKFAVNATTQGSATVDIDVETKFEGSGDWVKTDSFSQITSANLIQSKNPAFHGSRMRLKIVVASATSANFEIVAGYSMHGILGQSF